MSQYTLYHIDKDLIIQIYYIIYSKWALDSNFVLGGQR